MTRIKTLSEWPELYSPDDLCKRWGISRSTFGRWKRKGKIPGTRVPFPYMRIGGKLRLSDEQVALVEKHMVAKVKRERKS